MAAKHIPPFWPTKPELWFLRVEGIMEMCHVTDDVEKFNIVVSFLDFDTLDGVDDLVSTPPTQDKYKALKEAIIKLTAKTTEKKIQEVMSGMTLGDSKPSQLWRRMKQHAGTHIDEAALKVRWLDLLPSTVSMMLELVDSADMAKVADTADKLLEASRTSVMAVGPTRSASPGPRSPASSSSARSQEIEEIRAALQQLTALVLQQGAGQQQRQCNGHQQQRSRSRSRSRGRATAPAGPDGWCWYHRKHGAGAMRCTIPCTFKATAASSSTPGNI